MASRLESRKSSARKSSSKAAERKKALAESAHSRSVRSDGEFSPQQPPPRRSAEAPVARPANENEPTTAAIVGSLKQQPSAVPFFVASLVSALWLIAYTAYLLSANRPQAEQLGGFGQVFSQMGMEEIIVLFAMAVLPIVLVGSISYLMWRAQQMRQVSETLVQTALRLIRPEDVANEGFSSIGQAVRRELGQLVGGVEHAISRGRRIGNHRPQGNQRARARLRRQ